MVGYSPADTHCKQSLSITRLPRKDTFLNQLVSISNLWSIQLMKKLQEEYVLCCTQKQIMGSQSYCFSSSDRWAQSLPIPLHGHFKTSRPANLCTYPEPIWEVRVSACEAPCSFPAATVRRAEDKLASAIVETCWASRRLTVLVTWYLLFPPQGQRVCLYFCKYTHQSSAETQNPQNEALRIVLQREGNQVGRSKLWSAISSNKHEQTLLYKLPSTATTIEVCPKMVYPPKLVVSPARMVIIGCLGGTTIDGQPRWFISSNSQQFQQFQAACSGHLCRDLRAHGWRWQWPSRHASHVEHPPEIMAILI